MNIVFYSTSLTRSAGGLYQSVSGLATALSRLGARVTSVGGADNYFDEDKAVWEGVSLVPHSFPLGRYGLAASVFRDLYRLRPDVLHIHGIWSAASVYGALGRFLGRRVVVSPHGMLDPWILARRPRIKAVHGALFEHTMLRGSHVHALNAAEKEAVIRYMPSINGRVFVLPNGISRSSADGKTMQRKGFLYLGRLHEKKQVLQLMRAFSSSPALHAQQLMIAGWGEPAYEAEVKALAGSESRISFVGSVYGQAKKDVLLSARFFVLPSLSEGLPMAVLEAIQYGCIPLITESCNLPELIQDDIALSMSPDFSDFNSVAEQLISLSEPDFQTRSQRARDYAQRYLWENIGRDMLRNYERILKAH